MPTLRLTCLRRFERVNSLARLKAAAFLGASGALLSSDNGEYTANSDFLKQLFMGAIARAGHLATAMQISAALCAKSW